MATILYLLDAAADTHLGTDNTNLLGTAVGWTSKSLGLTRGGGVVASDNVATVTGATTGIVVTKTSPVEWLSPPVAADVTISSSINFSLWASESNMSANVAIRFVVDVVRANATATRNSNTIEEILRSTSGSEVAVTTRGLIAGATLAPGSAVTVNRGDRIRIRLYGADSGTMATGFTFNASWNGATASADGDSYVSFTENFSFEGATPGVVQISAETNTAIGDTAGHTKSAASFVVPSGVAQLTEVRLRLFKLAAPTDNLVVELQADSSGLPSGTTITTVATVAGTSLTTSSAEYTYSTSATLTAGATYWLVFSRSSAIDAVNYYAYDISLTTRSGWTYKQWNGSSWAVDGGFPIAVRLAFTTSTLYLTDTASAVSTASQDLEAWTSRGSGVVTSVTNTAAGWTAPLQATTTAGGTVIDWFTRPLAAFTLTGMAVANIRALESNASANASLRCEIARVSNTGTSPTVWSSWCCAPTGTDNGELTTSEVARTLNLSGDDLAIANGERLRIRLYNDDSSAAAMGASQTVTRYYSGTSAAASGDSYITLPQTVTEYSAAAQSLLLPNRSQVVIRR